jgi:hypothetical protein
VDDSADAVRCIAGELDDAIKLWFPGEVTMEDDSDIFIVVSEGKRCAIEHEALERERVWSAKYDYSRFIYRNTEAHFPGAGPGGTNVESNLKHVAGEEIASVNIVRFE